MDISLYVILAFVVLFFASSYVFSKISERFHYNLPDGPPSWPFIGNLIDLKKKNMHNFIWDHKEKFGEISHFTFVGMNFISLNTVKAIREAMEMKEFFSVFSGRPIKQGFAYVNPNSVAMGSYSEFWSRKRQLLQTTFKPYGNDMREIDLVVTKELNFLKKSLEQTAGKPVDLPSYIKRSITNIMFVTMTGHRFDYGHELHDQQKRVSDLIIAISKPWNNGILGNFPFLRFLPVGVGKVYQDTYALLKQVVQHLYRDLKTQPDDVREGKVGFVYDMIRHQGREDWLKDDDVMGMIIDIFHAGIFTTSNSLNAEFLVFLHRPDIVEALQQEIDTVIGADRDPSLDDRKSMPYTQATVLETLRYSSISYLAVPHRITSDITFRGFHLPKDTLLVENLWKVHHDESNWPDPWTFKPERFLDENGSLIPPEHPLRRNLIPFGLGKRRCIGENFAKARMFLFITTLYQYFDVHAEDAENLPSCDPRLYKAETILVPPPFKVIISRRATSTNL